MKKYVLTGGPCTGKTTTVNMLASLGYHIIPEGARELIKEEQEKETNNKNYKGIFPWDKPHLFQPMVLEKQILLESQHVPENTKDNCIFLDRSIIDPFVFSEIMGVELKSEFYKLITGYKYDKVFFLEQLQNYVQDEQRKEDISKAEKIHNMIYNTYKEMGFGMIIVPAVSVEERIRIILESIRD